MAAWRRRRAELLLRHSERACYFVALGPRPARQAKDAGPLYNDACGGLAAAEGSRDSAKEAAMAKLLITGTHGTDDPTRASMPFHLAKGAKEAGCDVEINLAIDAPLIMKDGV